MFTWTVSPSVTGNALLNEVVGRALCLPCIVQVHGRAANICPRTASERVRTDVHQQIPP